MNDTRRGKGSDGRLQPREGESFLQPREYQRLLYHVKARNRGKIGTQKVKYFAPHRGKKGKHTANGGPRQKRGKTRHRNRRITSNGSFLTGKGEASKEGVLSIVVCGWGKERAYRRRNKKGP